MGEVSAIGLAALALGTSAASLVLTGLASRVLRRRGVLDRPNPRSSHTRPTPRGGGLAVMAALALGWLAAAALRDLSDSMTLGLGGGAAATVLGIGLALAVVSWLDDLRDLPLAFRLAVQGLAVAAGVSLLPEQGLVLGGLVPLWADRGLAALAWLWFVNLYNFMDGIDGLSAVETVSIGIGVAAVALLADARPALAAEAIVVAGAMLGFLWWNRPPARIFLGDVGSIPLGYLVGWLLLSLAAAGQWAAAALLPAYYLADATVTLLRRLARGAPVWRAHAEHHYQHAARAVGHGPVVGAVAITDVGLVALAVLTVAAPRGTAAWLILGAAFAAALLWYLARRMPSPQSVPRHRGDDRAG